MSEWFTTALGTVTTLIMTWAGGLPGLLVSALSTAGTWLWQTGWDAIAGLTEGMTAGFLGLRLQIGQWVTDNIIAPVKGLLGIGSPSTVFIGIGLDIINGLVQGLAGLGVTVSGLFSGAWAAITSITVTAWSGILGFLNGILASITGLFSGALAGIQGILSGAWASISANAASAWATVYGNIAGAWDRIVAAVSQRVNDVVTWASGLPGRVSAAIGDLSGTLYGKGSDLIQGLLNGASKALGDLGGWANGIKDKVVDAIKAAFGIHSPSTVFAGLGEFMMQGLLKGLLQSPEVLKAAVQQIGGNLMSWFGGIGSRIGEFFSGLTGGVGAGVERWAGVAAQAMALAGLPAQYLPLLLQRMNVESGGNPNAINLWDSNAAAGTPSMGLMQTIGPTFNAYAGPLRDRGITDPLANIYAAIMYTLARYGLGGLPRAWGGTGGYALGTGSAAPGWSLVGEQGPEWMRFRGGEQVLPYGQLPNDPAVRALAARGGADRAGVVVERGAIVVNTPSANPVRVAEAVLDRMVLAAV